MSEKTKKISELIRDLEAIKAEHGDLYCTMSYDLMQAKVVGAVRLRAHDEEKEHWNNMPELDDEKYTCCIVRWDEDYWLEDKGAE